MRAIHFLIYCSIGCLSGFWLLLNPADAAGPSFDCAKATTRAEKAICQDAQLGDLDASLLATLKAALEKDSAARDHLLSEERLWVRDRDRACILPNISQTTNIISCLREAYRKRIGALRLERSQPVVESSNEASKAVCHKMVDRYKALVKADPEAPYRKRGFAETPLELLAESTTSGITVEPEIGLDEFDKDPGRAVRNRLPQEAAAVTLSGILEAFPDPSDYVVRFSQLEGKNLFRLSSIRGTESCNYDVLFSVKGERAQLIKQPDNWSGPDSCGVFESLGEIDKEPFAFEYENTSIRAFSWDGIKLAPACKISFEFAPHFSLNSPFHKEDKACEALDCDALRQAVLGLAEFVNSNQTDSQKRLIEMLLPSQRRDFDILKEKSKKLHTETSAEATEMTDSNPLLVPLMSGNRLYLARVGHFTMGWRNFPDWSVVVEERDKDTVAKVATFAIGMTDGKLLKADVQ